MAALQAATAAFFILLYPGVIHAASCPSDWVEYGHSCYLLAKGDTGRSFEEARNDCRSRDSSADLVWVTSETEMQWLTDYSARKWGIKDDWRDCTDCATVEGVWIGMYRDTSDGQLKWTKDKQAVTVNIDWFSGHPRPSPSDFVFMFDTGSRLRFRTEQTGAKLWHMCKVQHTVRTGSTTAAPGTTTPPYTGPCPSREWSERGHACYLLVKGGGGDVDAAVADCQTRDSKARLMWADTEAEMEWVMETAKSKWRLREDWGECSGCPIDPTAWIGLWRQSGTWRWRFNNQEPVFSIKWMPGHPRDSPSNFTSLYESPSNMMYVRSETATQKLWHVCKYEHSPNTETQPPTTTTLPPTTTTTAAPTTTPPYFGSCPSADWVEQGDFCYLLAKGNTGRSFEEARNDCRSRDSSADLVWVTSETEMQWLTDYSARKWGIKDDWRDCTDCATVEGVWIGLYRDTSDGQLKWTKDKQVTVNIDWFPGNPRPSPSDFVFMFDTGSRLRFRTEQTGAKLWHMCKVQHTVRTGSTTAAPGTTTPPYTGPCPSREWSERGHACYLLVKGGGGDVNAAVADCQTRDSKARLMWADTEAEMEWVMETAKSKWRLREDWGECSGCPNDPTAWIGLWRQSGTWRWRFNNQEPVFSIKWMPGHPRDTPSDFASLYESPSNMMYVRSETSDRKLWHVCKYEHSRNTETQPPTTTAPTTAQPTTTSLPPTTSTPYTGNCPSADWQEYQHACYLLAKGSSGRVFSTARLDCRGRASGADLLWVESQDELRWVTDYSARQWGIKRHWRQCEDCGTVEGAWFGFFRDSRDGRFRWVHDESEVTEQFNWWSNNPRPSPRDFGVVYDSGRQLWFRTEAADARFWHFCKRQFGENTASTRSSSAGPTRYPPGPCASTDWTEFGDSCYLLAKADRGVGWSEAAAACGRQHGHADLLWISSTAELRWFTDYAARDWRLKADYARCADCDTAEGAWIGLFRDVDGVLKWRHDRQPASSHLLPSWWPGNPGPQDNAFVFDSGSRLWLRTAAPDKKFWYFCKYNYREVTPAPTPSPTPEVATTTRGDGPCPAGWQQLGGNCYSVLKPSSGATWPEARTACRSADASADLLWIDSEAEYQWIVDHAARRWGIKRDWSGCDSCSRDLPAVWVGLYRDTQRGGLLKWYFTGSDMGAFVNWWPSNPRPSPRDFALLYDTGTQLRMRTEAADARLWLMCKSAGRLPGTPQPQVSGWSSFWSGGGGHVFWAVPLACAVAAAFGFAAFRLRQRGAFAAGGGLATVAKSPGQGTFSRENPVFNNFDPESGPTVELDEALNGRTVA